MGPGITRQIKPAIFISLNIQRSIIDKMVIYKQVISTLRQLSEFRIKKPLLSSINLEVVSPAASL